MRVSNPVKKNPAESEQPRVNGSPAASGLIPAAPLAAPVKRRRSTPFLAAAVALVIAGGGLAVWAVNASGERSAVVGVAAEVQWGEVITEQDLAQVQVVGDVNLRPVPWDQRASLVGKRAATDLLPGGLFTAGSVMGDPVPAQGQAVVGVSVKAAQAPSGRLSPQDQVQLVVAPEAGGSAAPKVYKAEVLDSSSLDASGGRTIDVLVASGDAAQLAVAAAAGDVIIVLVPKG